MKDRKFKTREKVGNLTKDNRLNNWRKYYDKTKEYHLNRNRTYYLERMVGWYEWFEEIGVSDCEICGFNKHPKAIDFHHINSKEKEFGIGKFINGRQCNDENKIIVKKEIDKCMTVCANCHRILHFNNEHTNR